MAFAPLPSPTKETPSSSKWKQIKALETKKRLLKKRPSNPEEKAKKVSFDIAGNTTVSYEPKVGATHLPDSNAKSSAMELATEVQASLPSEFPSFVKSMLPSHVSGGFWLGFPKKFCGLHLPKHDDIVVLVDEDEQEFNTKYLVEKTGLSGGWRGFSIAHMLVEGDALVFQLVKQWKIKVYIVRVNRLNEIDGALGLLNLVPYGKIEKDTRNLKKLEDMDIDLHQEKAQEKGMMVFDLSGDGSDDVGSEVSEGLRFSQSVVEFKDVKGIEDFNILIDDLVIDSEIPKHFRIKYFDLCRSQNTYLHENLLKGLNIKLAVGIILETITIADAIRACKVTTTHDDFETWDKTLKAFEEVGMKVGFLRVRINKLVSLLFESQEVFKAKRDEQAKAEEEMRVIEEKLFGVKEMIKNLNVEIEGFKLKGKKLEPLFQKEANAPW